MLRRAGREAPPRTRKTNWAENWQSGDFRELQAGVGQRHRGIAVAAHWTAHRPRFCIEAQPDPQYSLIGLFEETPSPDAQPRQLQRPKFSMYFGLVA
jgi:hypothetical protein